MMAISPQFCSYGWLLDDPISHEQEMMSYFSRERPETSQSTRLLSPSSNDGSLRNKTVKKLNHNASERDRRQKMNTLYSSLRSLLPPQDQSKKMSISVTVSRVLKYIPELQKEVGRLIQKKEKCMPKVSMAEAGVKKTPSSTSAVSATPISEGEIVIQISMPRAEKGSFAETILRFEEEGFLVVNASCFESFQGRHFYNLHLQAQEGQVIDAEKLKEKAWPYI